MLLASVCVSRRPSDSSSGWLDDQYSSVSSRHQLSWPRHQRPPPGGELSPQPAAGSGDDRPRGRATHAVTVDEKYSDRHQGDRCHSSGRQRQPLASLTQPSSLSALVEYVSLSATSLGLVITLSAVGQRCVAMSVSVCPSVHLAVFFFSS